MGIRLCPPLRILASSPCCCSRPTASGSVLGRRYSKAGGIMGRPPLSTSKYCVGEQHKAAIRRGVPYITCATRRKPLPPLSRFELNHHYRQIVMLLAPIWLGAPRGHVLQQGITKVPGRQVRMSRNELF